MNKNFDYHGLMSGLDEYAAYVDHLKKKKLISAAEANRIIEAVDTVQNMVEDTQ